MNTFNRILKSVYGLNMASSNKTLRTQVAVTSLGHSALAFLLMALITLAAGMSTAAGLAWAGMVAVAVLIVSLAWGLVIIEAGRITLSGSHGEDD